MGLPYTDDVTKNNELPHRLTMKNDDVMMWCDVNIADMIKKATTLMAPERVKLELDNSVIQQPVDDDVLGVSTSRMMSKEDPWNSIISAAAAATGGFLSMRRGFAASAKSAAIGAVLLGLIEGTGIALNKFSVAQQDMPPVMIEDMPPQPPKSSWFGGAKEEEKIANGGSEVKILESFHDAPPLPSFEYK
ncbi:mitochondrial import inner membrane translocase subunit TIM17-2-like protein [Trifolium pratense]|uniref:Mitochondrial import inner membrane translocase subunit TIM17-2-like protein n=1 Tax=Trifolium pratense TaxID=57577 RepID=A0A2K3P8A0_TRIPR|nr:mitochondrial import inner membrane translocase subunit TIM17-2-like protein [Trifolium pratense]